MKVPQKDYNLNSFIQYILHHWDEIGDEEGSREELKAICVLTSRLDWVESFLVGDMKNVKQFGKIFEITLPYIDKFETPRVAIYYAHYDYEKNLAILFTTTDLTEGFKKTAEKIIKRTPNLWNLWIRPTLFDTIETLILSNHPEAQITYFSANRRFSSLIKSQIRPRFDRSIQYRGKDGSETLREFKYYYGVLPTVVEYTMDDIVLRVNAEGIFTLKTANKQTIDLFLKLLDRIIEETLDLMKTAEELGFSSEKLETERKVLTIPCVEPGEIQMETKLTMEDAKEMLRSMEKEGFSAIDTLIDEGSLSLSATVMDSNKGSVFDISASESKITLIPKYRTSFDSFLRFFAFITENVDKMATFKKFSDIYG
ncbi:MAG: hypothetical protein HXS48_03075 [Theionarchaea archaeon]|nr:hypothetical protein [Theionarchaea archaeon]